MALSYDVLREYAKIIRDEKKTGANTALRVGDMFVNIIDSLQDSSKKNENDIQSLSQSFTSFLEGTDTDSIINKWMELEGFLAGFKETDTLAGALALKQNLITKDNKLPYSYISGTPTALKNPTSLTFGSKSYDGSEAKEITASDLGALTSHQAIFALTIQKNGVDVGTYTPNSAVKTINITDVASADTLSKHIANKENPHGVTKAQVGLGNVENTQLSTWVGSSNITTLGVISHALSVNSGIELNKNGALENVGGYIDFHYNGSEDDYTSRIIESASGVIKLIGDVEVTKSFKIGTITLKDDNGVLRIDKSVASDGAMSSLGVSEGGTGGGGSVDWGAIPADMLPVGQRMIGRRDNRWYAIYGYTGYFGDLSIDGSISAQQLAIGQGTITIGGKEVATKEYVTTEIGKINISIDYENLPSLLPSNTSNDIGSNVKPWDRVFAKVFGVNNAATEIYGANIFLRGNLVFNNGYDSIDVDGNAHLHTIYMDDELVATQSWVNRNFSGGGSVDLSGYLKTSGGELTGGIYPNDTDSLNLGTLSNKWNNVYAKTYVASNAYQVTGNSGTFNTLEYQDGATKILKVGYGGTTSANDGFLTQIRGKEIQFILKDSGAYPMVIKDNKVLIGYNPYPPTSITVPQYALHVNGDGCFENGLTVKNGLTVDGKSLGALAFKDNIDIVDKLDSTSTTSALSAAQGKVLNEKFGSYVLSSALGDYYTKNEVDATFAKGQDLGNLAGRVGALEGKTIVDYVGSTKIGSATNPVYWNGSKFVKTTYTLNKTVPANAAFTDTTYTFATGDTDGTIKVDSTEIAVKGFSDLATAINTANQTLMSLGSLAFKNSLSASDIPSLNWSKITSGKPTTLTGYGITDALSTSGGSMYGVKGITIFKTKEGFEGCTYIGSTSLYGVSKSEYQTWTLDNNDGYGYFYGGIKIGLGTYNLNASIDKDGNAAFKSVSTNSLYINDLPIYNLISGAMQSYDDEFLYWKYLPLSGGTLTGALTASYLRTTSTSEAALLTGGKTTYNDGKAGIGLLASGTIATTGSAPKIIFYYGNATSGTHYLESLAGNLFRITTYLEVFNSNNSGTTYLQLNKNNNRIYRFENESTGLTYKYGTSTSGVTTKGTFSTSGSYSASSDITKKDVHSYEPRFSVEDIANAPVVYFTWNDLNDGNENLGTIAQYWKMITPQCVYGKEGVDMTLDYATLGLVSSIINARKIVDHEERIKALEEENERLKNIIVELKKTA